MNEDFQDIDYDLMFSSVEEEDVENFGGEIAESSSNLEEATNTPPIREKFPKAGTSYLGGKCDGYIYHSVFVAKKLEATYEMIVAFLKDEGFGDLPIPRNTEELLKFKIPSRNKQILMFEDNGYAHNPIKILFPENGRKKSTLILEIYNEKDENHLLKFHRKA